MIGASEHHDVSYIDSMLSVALRDICGGLETVRYDSYAINKCISLLPPTIIINLLTEMVGCNIG